MIQFDFFFGFACMELDPNQLSPLSHYYLRRLLLQCWERLQPEDAQTTAELLPVSNYRFDPERLLSDYLQDASQAAKRVQELERLLSFHQRLVTQGKQHQQDVANLELHLLSVLNLNSLNLRQQQNPNAGLAKPDQELALSILALPTRS